MKRSSLALACALFAVTACHDAGPPTEPAFAPVPQLAMVSNTLTGEPQGSAVLPTPSSNAQNYASGWAHVLFVDAEIGQVELNFVSQRAFWSCFEYRADNEPNTVAGANPNPAITDGRWTQVCRNNTQGSLILSAQTHVDVRMVYGAETDERFDWTRFFVLPGYVLTLDDEAGNPLPNQAGVFKYRCGGSWAPSVSFTTDGNGNFSLNQPACANWDNKVTVTVNQTSKEQDVTVHPEFQTAKVNATLTSCTGPITATPGGTVAQGGGHWFTHGTTGPSGTVSFYTFPGSIKVRMNYNQLSVTQDAIAVIAGANEVTFPTTKVTMVHPAGIRSNTGGSWWNFAQPSMDLQPGTYNFQFRNGTTWGPLTPFVISGCSGTLLRVVDELGNGVAGATAEPAIGGSWQPLVPGTTNAGGYLFGSLPTGTTKVRMAVNGTNQEKSSAQMTLDNNTWTTQLLRIRLNDHAGVPIVTGATLQIGLGGWPSLGNLGTNRDIPLFSNQNFRVTYNSTTEQKSGVVVVGPGIQELIFQTGQVVGSCSNYAGGGWQTFTSGMQLMPGARDFRYPQASFTVLAGQVNNVPCN